jgi:hypothetical protein
MDEQVTPDSAGARQKGRVRRPAIVAGGPDDLDAPGVPRHHPAPQLLVGGVVAALEAHHHRHVVPLEVLNQLRQNAEVQRGRLLAQHRHSGLDRLPDQGGMGGCRCRDDHPVHLRQDLVKARTDLPTQVGGRRGPPGRVTVGQYELRLLRDVARVHDTDPAETDDSDAHRRHPAAGNDRAGRVVTASP